jgi:septal ring factor EnvC (AmiA/AmiB activator)
MPMESILKKLEGRIEEFVRAHEQATARVAELESRVAELEAQLADSSADTERLRGLEEQRDDLAERLGKVLETIDSALSAGSPEAS